MNALANLPLGSQTAGTVIAGPEAGRLWHIHRLSFAPAQIGQAVATPGTIIIGKGTGIQTATQGSGQIVTGNSQSGQFVEIDRTTTVPGKLTYGRGQFVLVSPMNLIVLWASGTNATSPRPARVAPAAPPAPPRASLPANSLSVI